MLQLQVEPGQTLNCLYPTGGTSNVFKIQSGIVESVGVGLSGPYVTIKKINGLFRCLSASKMSSVEIF